MIYTDGKPTIANGAGDIRERLAPEPGAIHGQRKNVEDEWAYGARTALTILASELEAVLLEGGALSVEDVIGATREIAGRLDGN